MSTGKTTYLGLHRWEPDDDFLRTEFNENSDKLDEELETMQKEMAGEFSAVRGELSAGLSSVKSELGGAISEVQTAVNGKAAASHTHDYAASSHNHAAGNITSGTLPVARGGTGNTSVDTTPTSGSTKMVTSGGVYTALSGKAASTHSHTPASIGAAASSHNHAAGNITSGTLPVARGGTGVTGMAALVTALQNAGALKTQTGTYTGTGTCGSANPNRITFSFPPKLVFVAHDVGTNDGGCGFVCVTPSASGIFNYSSTRYNPICSLSGNVFSWYVTIPADSLGALYQCNRSGYTYRYLAFG